MLVQLCLVLILVETAISFKLVNYNKIRNSMCLNLSQQQLRMSSLEDSERPKMNLIDQSDKPKFAIKGLDELEPVRKPEPFSTSTPKSRLEEKMTKREPKKPFGNLTMDELRKEKLKNVRKRTNEEKLQQLNGIEPAKPLSFAIVPAIMSVGFWKVSNYLAAHFAIQFVNADLYPVQRIAVVARNIVVGMTSLAAGFSGVISLGLIALGVRVAVGIAKGELDPNKSNGNSE